MNKRKIGVTAFTFVYLALLLIISNGSAMTGVPGGYSLSSGQQGTDGRPPSNSIIDMEYFGNRLWLATGGGVGIFIPETASPDPGAGQWATPPPGGGFGPGGVSGLAIGVTSWGDTVLWAATATDYVDGGESYAAGGGVGFSLDDGHTWYWYDQPVDPRDTPENRPLLDSLGIDKPTTTHVLNVTYDIGLTGDRVWIASWAGGLRYLDMREDLDPSEWTWINRPPDNEPFDVLEHLNHRPFSIANMVVDGDTLLWVGTAAGINKYDFQLGEWFRYSHNTDSTISSPSGNFVTALGVQELPNEDRRLLWAATWVAEGNTEFYGVSLTEDYGITWRRVLGSRSRPVRAHNFAFDGHTAYVASDDGLYQTMDLGETWALYPPIHDLDSLEFAREPEIYCAAVGGNRLWVGGPAGLGVTADNGSSWRLMRTYPLAESASAPETYAYPNPFSPSRFDAVRMHYRMKKADTITLEIYDFAMELLIRPVNHQYRPAGYRTESWNGRGPNGVEIANGVYYYRINGGGEERWGKILILD